MPSWRKTRWSCTESVAIGARCADADKNRMKLQNSLVALAGAALATVSPVWANASSADGHHHGAPVIGEAGDASQVTRTVQVEMRDRMRFVPSKLSVEEGETLRLVVKNAGQLRHEMVLGSEGDLKAHAEMMKKSPQMAHPESNTLTVAPGATGELVWKFSQAGVVNFACLQPGHYEAGMKGQVRVTATKAFAKGAPTAAGHHH